MRVVVKHVEPVVKPVEEVTITLSQDEAVVLKLIANYRHRVGFVIADTTGRGKDRPAVHNLLFDLWQELHEQGVHAGDR